MWCHQQRYFNLVTMIKVLRHGNTIEVKDPVTGKWNRMVNVVFIEEGRTGGNAHMTATSQFLSDLVGENVGLEGRRIHTHPVREDKIDLFGVHKDYGGESVQEYPGHINRGLFSTPQLEQQVGVDPQMIDGRPTYFTTWIDSKPEEDLDQRISNDILMQTNPSAVYGSQVRRAEVRIIENRGASGTFNMQQTSDAVNKVKPEPALK